MILLFNSMSIRKEARFTIRYGLVPATGLSVSSLGPNQSSTCALELARSGAPQPANPPNLLQVAVKNSIGVYYFATLIPEGIIQ